VEQAAVLFGLTKSIKEWTPKTVAEFANDLFVPTDGSAKKRWSALEAAMAELAQIVTTVNEIGPAAENLALPFWKASCSLLQELTASMEWRLRTQDQPAELKRFRAEAGCPTAQDAVSAVMHRADAVCTQVIYQHSRLFAARLAESVVMEALSYLKQTQQVAEKFGQQLDAALPPEQPPAPAATGGSTGAPATRVEDLLPKNCKDLKRMRLAWIWDAYTHETSILGDIRKYVSALPDAVQGRHLMLGLNHLTQFGPLNRARIQTSLTQATRHFSRLSTANAHLTNVMSPEVLDMEELNPELDAQYKQIGRNFQTRSEFEAQCDAIQPNIMMLRSLVELWASWPSYPSALTDALKEKPQIRTVMETPHFQKVQNLHSSIQKVKDALDSKEQALTFRTSTLQRIIYMVLEERKRKWVLPLTWDYFRSPGLYSFVMWMLCKDKILDAEKVTIKGELWWDGKRQDSTNPELIKDRLSP
jgi:hypothetical protein